MCNIYKSLPALNNHDGFYTYTHINTNVSKTNYSRVLFVELLIERVYRRRLPSLISLFHSLHCVNDVVSETRRNPKRERK